MRRNSTSVSRERYNSTSVSRERYNVDSELEIIDCERWRLKTRKIKMRELQSYRFIVTS